MKKILFVLALLPLLVACGDSYSPNGFLTEKECVKAVYNKAAGDYHGYVVKEDNDIIDTLGEVDFTVGGSKNKKMTFHDFPVKFFAAEMDDSDSLKEIISSTDATMELTTPYIINGYVSGKNQKADFANSYVFDLMFSGDQSFEVKFYSIGKLYDFVFDLVMGGFNNDPSQVNGIREPVIMGPFFRIRKVTDKSTGKIFAPMHSVSIDVRKPIIERLKE